MKRYYEAGLDAFARRSFIPGIIHGECLGAITRRNRERRATHEDVLGCHLETVLGEAIDVDGLIERFDSLEHTNAMLKTLWLNHGIALAQRATAAAQDILNRAIVPTGEFASHSAVIAMGEHAKVLGDKIVALPNDEAPVAGAVWDETRNYFVEGSRLVNQLEGVASGALKWSDVKESVQHLSDTVKQAADDAKKSAQWTSTLLIGGAVILGGGILYALYKVIVSDTGKAVATSYLGRRF